ncbi:hypothetical protein INT46_009401 [Mucor plumbeus]|uniref:Uncharacterized protein n=1 Tax=Mucor plumbeus TaxID=97098 RepID=A0A8H7R9L6_9FUNG|nr:hypothetical protein INT46_009401 [Mucor plumbeus]
MIEVKGIAKLNEYAINRIAAGEIIHHSCNVVKELMENSLDAGSSSISITLAVGEIDLIKVKDNGDGIQVKDLPLVCERYATSKIQKFQDLNYLTTFGFRGEALASISNIANVTIVTKNADTPHAIKFVFMLHIDLVLLKY